MSNEPVMLRLSYASQASSADTGAYFAKFDYLRSAERERTGPRIGFGFYLKPPKYPISVLLYPSFCIGYLCPKAYADSPI